MSEIYEAVYWYIWNSYSEHYSFAYDFPNFFCELSVNHIQSIVKRILQLGELFFINTIDSVYLIALLYLRA